MHPDRRRRGRAIRKQRRLARALARSPLAAVQAFQKFHRVMAVAAAALTNFANAFAAIARLETAEARLSALGRAWPAHRLTLERHDMTTVTITAPSSAPTALIDHLTAFARDLDGEGITAHVELIRTCIVCGCTDDHACPEICAWVNASDDLCTSCDTPHTRDLAAKHTAELSERAQDALTGIAAAQANGALVTFQAGGVRS